MRAQAASGPAPDSYLRNIIGEMERSRPFEPAGQDLGRRGFLKLSGLACGGLVLAFSLRRDGTAQAQQPAPGTQPSPGTLVPGTLVPNAFLRIGSDGEILIFCKGPEIGQGLKTSFPMIVAEELDADWADVRIEQAPIMPHIYGRQSAGGSNSIEASFDQLRRAGAVARSMLVAAAAQQWGVAETACATENSFVVHAASGRRLGYGALAAAASQLPIPDDGVVRLKDRKEWKLIGTRVAGVENVKIVMGAPLYGIDQVVPNMVYASYTKCPAVGGRVVSVNLDHIKTLPGVSDAFVIEGNGRPTQLMPGIAIIANSTWAAIKAKRALQVVWDESRASKDSWSDAMRAAEHAVANPGGVAAHSITGRFTPGAQILEEKGNIDAALAAAAHTVEAFYSYPFLSHAPLEPQNCTAWYHDGGIEVWAPTQAGDRQLPILASIMELPEERVTIHQTRVGGGFGRRLQGDYMYEAAAIAKRIGVPVKLQWTREDDFAHDFYRAGGFHAFRGGLGADGRLTVWDDHFVTFSDDGVDPVAGGDMRHELPGPFLADFRITQTMLPLAIPCGPWRAPRSNGIAFAEQSFMNELAFAAGRDPIEFMLELLGAPRWVGEPDADTLHTGRAAGVIRLVAEKAGWGRAMPEGRGLGFAFYFDHSGHVAEIADVSVSPDRKITVHKITAAVDVGPIVNLSGAEAQVEGGVIDGLSTMLGLEIGIENGRIQQSNFDRYPILRLAQAPEVEAHFIQSDFPPSGMGEPPLPPVAPAVCNAIFAATGENVRSLPLSKHGFTV